MKKIALIGSAPSSVQLGPYDDPSWTIWGCSPGARPFVKRCEAWWEIHRREPGKPWFDRDYVKFMAELKCPVYVIEPWPELPTAVVLDTDEIIKRFGPYYFKSSLSWMVAKAVLEGANEVGLWGVDMAAQEEWVFQRTALQCLLWRIQEPDFGVNVNLPPESDLWAPGGLYGLQEINPHHVKILKRKEELVQRMEEARQQVAMKQRELDFLSGAVDDTDYHLKTWIQHPTVTEMIMKGPTKLASHGLSSTLPSVAEQPNETVAESSVPAEIIPPPKKRKRHKGNGLALVPVE